MAWTPSAACSLQHRERNTPACHRAPVHSMSELTISKPRGRRSPPHWRAVFLAALCEGRHVREACAAAVISYTLAYNERQRNPEFARAWDATRTATWRGRRLPHPWCALFLEKLAETGHVELACASAGIGRTAAYHARRTDPEVALAWNEALIAYLQRRTPPANSPHN